MVLSTYIPFYFSGVCHEANTIFGITVETVVHHVKNEEKTGENLFVYLYNVL